MKFRALALGLVLLGLQSCSEQKYDAAQPITTQLKATQNVAEDNDGAYLDPRYTNLVKVTESDDRDFFNGIFAQESLKKQKFEDAILNHSPVKSQGSRGTCSIFSAIATVENELIRNGYLTQADLSEEWLEYLIMRNRTSDGSDSYWNFGATAQYGFVDEAVMPYIGETWATTAHSTLAEQRCGHLSGTTLKSCLLGHRDPALLVTDEAVLAKRDPDFLRAKKNGEANLEAYLGDLIDNNDNVYGVDGIKTLLDQGIPVVLGLDFYYGAWNHRVANDLGIGRNMTHWDQGIVGYPEQGSMDRAKSHDDPAGHSIVLVGYDDDLEVETTVKMANGKTRNFTYRGVYYFKNSWGAASFGLNFKVGDKTYPGYGMITQKYAHEFGGFYLFTLKAASQ